ncbi:metallophosphoesterase [Brassicibacter mesophilus]|uniref:metallophosphoesterase n=1 Tax=Brassicibacter mesophilus TaxID=745119 RepID=UPI003D1AF713
MKVKDRIIEHNHSEDYRLIAISDIHGGAHLFRELIEKVGLRDSDYLVIIGDFLEKGEYNKQILDEMKKLYNKDRRFILSGNCEAFVAELLLQGTQAERMLSYIKNKPYKSILDDWIEDLDININNISEARLLQTLLHERNDKDIDFINSLPIALEFDNFIFVHGGIENRSDWKESNYETLIECKEFYKGEHRSDKTVVVGHWPTSNYRVYSNNGDVIIDNDKKILCIDGGYCVKTNGQINALIIEKTDSKYRFFSESVNIFNKYIVEQKNIGTQELPNKLAWPNNHIEIIKPDAEFSLCRRLDTKELISIKNELISVDGDTYYCNQDYQEYFLTVEVGDVISVVDIYGDYALAEFNGEFGWIESNKITLVD